MSKSAKPALDKLKEEVLERSLNLFILLAVLATGILFYRFYLIGEYLSLIVVVVVGPILVSLKLASERISHNFKVSTIVGLIFMVIIAGVYRYGLMAGAFPYMILIPVFVSLTQGRARATTVLITGMAVLSFLAYQFVNENLTYQYDTQFYLSKGSSWFLNLSILGFTGYVILDVLSVYNRRFREINTLTEDQNRGLSVEVAHKNDELKLKNSALADSINELESTQELLIEREKMASLGLLTAGIAHELKNPLASIQSSGELLAQDEALSDEDRKQILSYIRQSADHMTSIVKGLNEYSREQDSYEEECDLKAIIEGSLGILSHSYKNRIDIVKNYEDIPTIKGNAGKLHQVTTNLLGNAFQAIPGIGVVRIELKEKKNKVICKITDDGKGISKEDLQKLGTPFFSTKQNGEGTGLGLFISKKILFDHQAKLNFQSILGEGTTAKIVFPKS